MKVHIIAGVAAIKAGAQRASYIGNEPDPTYSGDQQQRLYEQGYSVGIGAARIDDGRR
jgi:hypothetical protein